jgi:hypothetical protein
MMKVALPVGATGASKVVITAALGKKPSTFRVSSPTQQGLCVLAE